MSRQMSALIGTAILALGLAACGSRAPLPPPPDAAAVERQAQAFVDALKPHREGRPVIAVLARNEGTEITDLLLPHAVLQRADVADVLVVAPRRGPVALYPALQVEAEQDFAGFDRAHPGGADYVVVPAMEVDNDPAVLGWLRQQAQRGAKVIGVCSGARVVGQAGLLDGRRFAGHWYDRSTLLERHPGATHVPHQRYVVDRGVATTTGITASVPTMLALVEALGGRAKAHALADELGVASWSPAHDSAPFGLTAGRGWEYVLNKAAFWRNQRWHVDMQDGTDDIALALAVDAWSRTGHIEVEPVSSSGPVSLRSGLVLATQPASGERPRLPLATGLKPVQQLDRTLCEIEQRYGDARREWVMQEMEYPAMPGACPS
ncbi:DJ-1/PfpI family protein [Caldimonas mangrovi]